MSARADDVWAAYMRVATHNLTAWRRSIAADMGLPMGRVRLLRMLSERSMGMGELADAAGIDAPAATVAVNDLERRALVGRVIDPANRRAKTVTLTAAGRDALAQVERLRPPAPPELAALDDADLEALAGILTRVDRARSVSPGLGADDGSRLASI
ncbi:MarR family winged helix-turn-helix transcriptional regulator [Subtercola sp. YIM 133946]|uniref:MarR family winged helix-turn-helix transcriptional regulator n=1 Tax=Subtercola sp. YIM 133946 TaxID=3118909 RepID=UPI002F95D39C